jgi:hypothetical protein
VLLAVSPLVRSYVYSGNFDRVADALVLTLMSVRLLELTRRSWKITAFDWLLFGFLFFFAASSLYNYLAGNFYTSLFLLEAKLPLFSIALSIFYGKTIPEQLARRLSTFMVACFVFGLLAFLIASANHRLFLLNESNYMVVAAFLAIVGFMSARRIVPFSVSWFLCSAFLVAVIQASQSRTAVAIFLAYVVFLMVRKLSIPRASLISILAVLLYALVDRHLLDVLFRGLASAPLLEIDRFVFLREYLSYLNREGWQEMLLASNVGSYMSHNVYYMGWWVARQSAQHGIEFGLAPFNFHSGYLRLLSAYGLIPTLILLFYVIALLRSRGWVLVLIVSLSLVSMSTLHLSSVVPFLILAMILMPSRAGERRFALPRRQPQPGLRHEGSGFQQPRLR